MVQINYFDAAMVLLLGAFAVCGFFRGFIREALGLGGAVLAFLAARKYQAQVEPHIEHFLGPTHYTGLITYTVVFTLVLAGAGLVGTLVRRLIMVGLSPATDRVLGVLLGLAKGVLLASFIYFLLDRILPAGTFVDRAELGPFFQYVIDQCRTFLPQGAFSLPKLIR